MDCTDSPTRPSAPTHLQVPPGYQALEQDSPFQQAFGPLYYCAKPGGALIGFVVEARHLNRYGNLHGGTLAAFMDVALGNAVLRQPAAPAADVTVSLSIDYLSGGAPGAFIEADIVVPKMGKRLAFANCEVRAEGRVIATARGIFSLGMPHRQAPVIPTDGDAG